MKKSILEIFPKENTRKEKQTQVSIKVYPKYNGKQEIYVSGGGCYFVLILDEEELNLLANAIKT
jgi:hypothetical protein